jgi:hypothetical protein
LWATVTWERVRCPKLAMPPPLARANGQSSVGHFTPLGELLVVVGVARFPATTTCRSKTVPPR